MRCFRNRPCALPLLSHHAPACAAPAGYVYVSPVSNYTYIYNTTMTDNKNAHKICNSQGGHLVAYQSLEEQVDVEQYFIKQVGAAQRL